MSKATKIFLLGVILLIVSITVLYTAPNPGNPSLTVRYALLNCYRYLTFVFGTMSMMCFFLFFRKEGQNE